MPKDKKYSIWPATFIICLAFVAPVTIGTIELRIARNAHAETDAIQKLQAIALAENEYRKSINRFSSSLEELKVLPNPEDSYRYDYRQLSPDAYEAVAAPKQPGKHGKRFFYLDQSGVVHYEILRPATITSPEVPPTGNK
jgi:uncharacterized membrane-anchored protein YhcB (DUF1043 family)